MSLASNPKDSSVIASASLDGTVKLWNVNGVSSQMTLSGHASGVNTVAFYAGDRTLLLSGGDDKMVILWDYQVIISCISHIYPISHISRISHISCQIFTPFQNYDYNIHKLKHNCQTCIYIIPISQICHTY